MQPSATKAGCRGPTIPTRHRNQRKPLWNQTPGPLKHQLHIHSYCPTSTSLSPSEYANLLKPIYYNQPTCVSTQVQDHREHWQRVHPATAASIGSNGQEPPRQLEASHAYRANTCPKKSHHQTSTGHGIADDGSAPRVGNTSMTPGNTSGAQPHAPLQCVAYMDGCLHGCGGRLIECFQCPLGD